MLKRRLLLLMLLTLMAACARLDYVKVPTPTQYSHWSDAQQAQADGMKGVRYYLPRPFVHLKQSVPVNQRVAIIAFIYDKDSNTYKLQLPPGTPEWAQRLAPPALSVAQALAASTVSVPGPAKSNTTGQGGTQAGNISNSTATNAASGGEASTSATTTETPAQTLSANVGYINETDPVTKLSPLMDIVYLPDFEEQYVIQPHMGFAGQAEVDAKLRNGWAAETFNQKTDSSQLIPYVIRQIQSASDTAAKIATTWFPAGAGVPLGALTSLSKTGSGPLQAGAIGAEDAKTFLGQSLCFKIAEVRVAQPGIYPILKPREILQWFKGAPLIAGPVSTDLDREFNLFLRQANVPWIRPDMAFIPCPPFTVVGFNITSDVFLAPATERVDLGTAGTGTSANTTTEKTNVDSQITGKITSAIKAALPNAPLPELKAVDVQNVVVIPKGEETIIRIQASTQAPFKIASFQGYSSWLVSTLKLGNKVTATLPPAADPVTTLVFTINEPASQIAGGLK